MHSLPAIRLFAPMSALAVVLASLLGTCEYTEANESSAATAAEVQSRSAAALTAAIDGCLEAAWAEAGITPAADVSDEAFVRRVFLDLAGRIPTTNERAAFLADDRSDRRDHEQEQLGRGQKVVARPQDGGQAVV